jgi:hypothetical protein
MRVILIVGGLAVLALVAYLVWGGPTAPTCPEGNLLTYQMCMANNSEAYGERLSVTMLGIGLVLAAGGLAVAAWRRPRRSEPH